MFNIFRQTKTPLRSDEYETLLKRNIDNEQRIRRLELNEDDFRNKVLRKLKERTEPMETNINSSNVAAARHTSGRHRLGGKSASLMNRG